ncbi:MAG: GNAT family N-acetyltransferase [Peptostreptococcaceae bacterium]
MNKFPRLETSRCILRKMNINDAQEMYEYASDDDVIKYLSFPKHDSVEQTREVISKYFMSKYEEGNSYDFGVELKETHKLIGSCGFNEIKNSQAILGYVLNKKYWNQGIMTELVKEVIRFGFEDLKLDKITAYHYDGNDKSGKVMQKCNMDYVGFEEREGRHNGTLKEIPIHEYEITKAKYLK